MCNQRITASSFCVYIILLFNFFVCLFDSFQEPAVAFAKKGYHILLEKPMAVSLFKHHLSFSVNKKYNSEVETIKKNDCCVYIILDNEGRLPNDCADLPSERSHAVSGSCSPLRSNHPQDKGQYLSVYCFVVVHYFTTLVSCIYSAVSWTFVVHRSVLFRSWLMLGPLGILSTFSTWSR